MARHLCRLQRANRPELRTEVPGQTRKSQWRQLASAEYLGRTAVIALLGLSAGLVLFGFNLWIPTNLRKMGFTEADAILRNAALIGFPLTFVVAWMYGFWSSKKTIIVLAALTAAALFGFVIAGDDILTHRGLLYLLLVIPIWGINSVVAVLSVYCVEVYPTRIRSRASGFFAAVSKAGGVLIIALVALGVAPPSIASIALIGAIPMALAVVAIALFGVETRKRRLEQIAPDKHLLGGPARLPG